MPTRKDRPSQLKGGMMLEVKDSKQTAMGAMLSEIKKKSDSKRGSFPGGAEEGSTAAEGGVSMFKLSRASVSSLSEQASIKHLIQMQISRANEQFNQIQSSLVEMVKLKEMLVTHNVQLQQKASDVASTIKEQESPKRNTIAATLHHHHPRTPTLVLKSAQRHSLANQRPAAMSSPMNTLEEEFKQLGGGLDSPEVRSPKDLASKIEVELVPEHDSLLEDQEPYQFEEPSGEEENIIAQIKAKNKKKPPSADDPHPHHP